VVTEWSELPALRPGRFTLGQEPYVSIKEDVAKEIYNLLRQLKKIGPHIMGKYVSYYCLGQTKISLWSVPHSGP
jgi:hypothetical protein